MADFYRNCTGAGDRAGATPAPRVFAAAAWVGSSLGIVFIVGAIFFTGFTLGRHAGHGGMHHHKHHAMMMHPHRFGGPGGPGGPGGAPRRSRAVGPPRQPRGCWTAASISLSLTRRSTVSPGRVINPPLAARRSREPGLPIHSNFCLRNLLSRLMTGGRIEGMSETPEPSTRPTSVAAAPPPPPLQASQAAQALCGRGVGVIVAGIVFILSTVFSRRNGRWLQPSLPLQTSPRHEYRTGGPADGRGSSVVRTVRRRASVRGVRVAPASRRRQVRRRRRRTLRVLRAHSG